MSETEPVLARLASLCDAKNDADLARYLDVSPSNIAMWRSRDTVPYKVCVAISRRENVSLDWLLNGEEFTNVNKTPRTQAIVEMIESLDDSQKQKIYNVIEDAKQLQEMKERIDQLLQSQAKKTA